MKPERSISPFTWSLLPREVCAYIESLEQALACIRIIENRLKSQGLDISCETAMKAMHQLNSCFCVTKDKRKASRIIETPTPLQAKIMKAFGYQVSKSGVLHKLSA